MHYLSNSDIDQISDHLKAEKINYSHLFEDLLDHLCCEVENKMERGLDFTSAFNSIKHTIGNNGLKDIQDATIFYVKLNLLVMKKTVKILGIISSVMVLLGIFFKTMHWPGASMLLFVGAIILVLGFGPIALFSVKRENDLKLFSKKFILHALGFVCLAVMAVGILFKIMHWPGGSALVYISFVLEVFVLFPVILISILSYSKKKLIPLTLLLFAFIVVTMNISGVIRNKVFYGNVYRYTITDMSNEIDYYTMKTKAFSKELDVNPEFAKLSEEFERNIALIDTQLKDILNGKANIEEVNRSLLDHPFNHVESYDVIVGLGDVLESYKQDILPYVSSDSQLKNLVENKLEAWDSNSNELYNHMQFHLNFLYADRVGIYNNLSRIKKDLLQVHYEVLQHLKDQKKS